MATAQYHDPALARMLILDELFDLQLYRALREVTDPDSRDVLDELIRVEIEHLAFWQKFFEMKLTRLDLGRRVKLFLLVDVCRLFGTTAVHLVLEAIEVHGVRKYLALWKIHKDGPLGDALQGILMDEFHHEDLLVTRLTARRINAEKIRNVFLGLNDGLIEILGAVSGFFGAFGHPLTVLVAASTTAVAGAVSMGAGAYLALNSEREMKATDLDKKRFLGGEAEGLDMEETPLASGLVVGLAYLTGAVVPVMPVLLGATDALFSVAMAGLMVIAVSTILSFLSGMDIRRRILMNFIIIAIAVGISYSIGLLAKSLWGLSV